MAALTLASLAAPGWAADPAGAPPADASPAEIPITELPPVADTRPEDFVYVAATRPDRIGRVMAPIFVNGVGPFAFVVDTGASSSVISPRVVARLGIEPDPGRSKLLRSITGSEIVPGVAVDRITAGEITLEARSLPVIEPRVFAGADGIFGADAFAHGCLYVNFLEANVSILRTGCPRVDQTWETLRAELRFGGLPVVRARVGRTRVLAIIDTGAERSLGNRALLAAEGLEPALQNPDTRREVFAATSQTVFGHLLKAPSVSFGNISIDNLSLVFGDFEVFQMWGAAETPAIVLGMDVLGTTQALMVDYKRAELRLLPQGAPNTFRVNSRSTPSRLP